MNIYIPKRLIKLCMIFFVLTACAGSEPQRNFNVIMYETDANCISWIDDDDIIQELCKGDIGFPEDLRGIKLEDYNRERDYQDTLINRCKKWKN